VEVLIFLRSRTGHICTAEINGARDKEVLRPGLQLSVVRKKLNVVADVGRRKLSVVADGTPEKGRRYSTFIHTERASVATFDLSDHTNQNIQSICYVYTRDIYTRTYIYIYIYLHTHTYIYIYIRVFIRPLLY
jgi:hypothetical protein